VNTVRPALSTFLPPREVYEELRAASAAQRAEIVIRLIEAHPQGMLVLPAIDGLHAVLDDIDLSPHALTSRGIQTEGLRCWDPLGRCMNLKGADLRGASLRNADLRQANLTASDLRGAALGGANLEGTQWDGSDLRGIDLAGVDLTGASLGAADLRAAMLEEANLRTAVLRFAKLGAAAFENAILSEADMWGAELEGAVLRNADLRGSILTDANLRHADLTGADLRDAILGRAVLKEATLRDAKLQGVDLTHCDLSQVRLSGAQLDGARFELEQLGGAIGEEMAGAYDQARRGYLVLERAFQDQGDHDASVWAYLKRRRMRKWCARETARAERIARHWGPAARSYTIFATDQLVEWLCDFGESVPRVLASLAVLYFVFTLAYGLTGSVVREVETPAGIVKVSTRNPVDLALFGLLAMTTGGSGQRLLPAHDLALTLVGIHMFLGVALVGLLGFVLGNRIRR
jgi:uncharacterized protein YjbI with pentapeptide repeats